MEVACREGLWREAVQQIAQGLAQRLEAARQLVEGPLEDCAGRACVIVAAAMDEALASLQRLNLSPEQRLGVAQVLWSIAGPWLGRGWLQTRAWTKPRGYAGDHELLAAIYHQRVADDPLGQLLDRYFQAQAAPQAVRNRMALASQWICQTVQDEWALSSRGSEPAESGSPSGVWSDRPQPRLPRRVKVALVGAATGLEVRQALTALPVHAREQLEVVLLDYDPVALADASRVLEGWLPEGQLHTVATNLARLPRRQAVWEHAPCDLMLIPGLLDYLDDTAAGALVAWGHAQLAPGGRLVVFQFAPQNPTRPYMEWIGDWRLIYRDRSQLAALAQQAGLPEHLCQIGAEPLGIDLFLSVVRQ